MQVYILFITLEIKLGLVRFVLLNVKSVSIIKKVLFVGLVLMGITERV
jgi:hypothetical protein